MATLAHVTTMRAQRRPVQRTVGDVRPSSAKAKTGNNAAVPPLRLAASAARPNAHKSPPKPVAVAYQPPHERLAAAVQECLRLDRELKVIENSGHTKFGVFAKPLGDQERCRQQAASAKQDTTEHLPEDPLPEAIVDDDDATSDPFFHRFYDEQGRSLFEQLLRTRMRVVALAKLANGRESEDFVRAEVELADTYARMNLWKQAHTHVMNAHSVLKTLDAKRATQHLQQQKRKAQGHHSDGTMLMLMLEYFYDRQTSPERTGDVVLRELLTVVGSWDAQESVMSAILESSNLHALFGASTSLHWQQVLLRMERQSAIFQDHVHDIEESISEKTRTTLRQVFNQLDPSGYGVVPLRVLITQLEVINDPFVDPSQLLCITESLRQRDERVEYPSMTWSELLVLSQSALRLAADAAIEDTTRDLRPRLKYFFGRFFLRKGQLEEATRYLQVAIAEGEQVNGAESVALVPYHLALAETLAVRYKQQAAVAQQNAFEIADKWLKSTEGSRRLRLKALELIDEHARRDGKVLPKKDAESQAREILLKEYATLSFVRPDPTLIEDAVEQCTKAWSLQEKTLGREHVTTASVHVTLAQIYATKADWTESISSYEQAIAIYEASCNGPVPASSLLRLEIAKIHHHNCQPRNLTKAGEAYKEVAQFFHSFAMEFASTDSTRRESCAQAIESWRQWVVLTGDSSFCGTMQDQKEVLIAIHDTTVDGYGDFSLEAAESAREVAQFLVKLGELQFATRYARHAWFVLESHFGSNDRRCRRAKKELCEITSELKSSLDPSASQNFHDHEWLTI
ncbi:hypothetical protein Poli38472_000811 [Pythium oligandrum]|uniref:Uncharacterized protein n=1 Tax=Pythium oligandrum TaxID=41045 RepID=A0A8K1CCZ1_PYTOL|nr:hypothetical protein Poli38472_000811 [Pythium oligandrum]|eukprot:TMW60769.1 hypothetical protein Poli38472_000811 [Pythium oligandrum]